MAPPSPTSFAGGRTSQLRKDSVFGRWVIFSPARARRPSEFKYSAHATGGAKPNHNPSNESPSPPRPPSCPFCIGNEHQCAPEIFRLPAGAAEWRVRVIENLYPALRRDEEPPASEPDGGAREGALLVAGYGFHDVVIETPYHGVHLSDLSPPEAGDVVLAYRERVLQLASMGSIKYVQVFKNHGASAGASMSHSHSQIMGLPVVPPTVSTRLNSMKECYDRTGKCSLCEAWSEEILILQSQYFFSIVPFAASYPFEIWIVPRDHASHFHEIDKEKEQEEKDRAEAIPVSHDYRRSSCSAAAFSLDDFEALGNSLTPSMSSPTIGERKRFSDVTRLGFASAHDSPALRANELGDVSSNTEVVGEASTGGGPRVTTLSFASVMSASKAICTPEVPSLGKKGKKPTRVLLSTAGGRRY